MTKYLHILEFTFNFTVLDCIRNRVWIQDNEMKQSRCMRNGLRNPYLMVGPSPCPENSNIQFCCFYYCTPIV